MIQSNELRIGNYIKKIDRRGKAHMPVEQWYEIVEIGFLEVKLIKKGETPAQVTEWDKVRTKDLSPIPFTPEICESFGFRKKGDFNGIIDQYEINIPVSGSNDNKILFCFSKVNAIQFGRYATNDYHSSNNFEYVHQFQNLHFALVGFEIPFLNIRALGEEYMLRLSRDTSTVEVDTIQVPLAYAGAETIEVTCANCGEVWKEKIFNGTVCFTNTHICYDTAK